MATDPGAGLAAEIARVSHNLGRSINEGKTDRNLMERLETLWLQDVDEFGGSCVNKGYPQVHWLWRNLDQRLKYFELDGEIQGWDDLQDFLFVLNRFKRLLPLNDSTIELLSNLDTRSKATILLLKEKEISIFKWLNGRELSPKASHQHIYSKEESLLSLASSLPEKHKNSDELCNVCYRGGYFTNFVSCVGCPRVFHKECVHLKDIPNGEWYCRCCRYQKNKVAGTSWNGTEVGEVDGIERRRSMRLVETKESDRGGCVLCRDHDFLKKKGFTYRIILLCHQCEREYHAGCLKDRGIQDLKELPQGNWFCCSGCEKINSTLQQLIKEGGQEIPDPLLNIIKGKYAAKYSEDVHNDVKWRLLSGNMCDVEQLLSDAVSIFQEQFSPIVVPGSRTDLIPFMVFGKNMNKDKDYRGVCRKNMNKDKDYRGVYCAVLTVNSQVVSAGILRVFGTEIAELPLIATSKYCENLGYFQALYYCIEKRLGEMEVKHLSLPAANEAKPLWTNKLGFSEFPKDELAAVGKWYQLMPFHGTSVLRKAVPIIQEAAKTTVTPEIGMDVVRPKEMVI